MQLIKDLNWRYATKKFDTSKAVAEADLEQIKEAIRLTPSSFGLQPYEVLAIESQEVREKLRAAAWGQAQVTDASHLFVFCSYRDIQPGHIDELFELKAKAYGKDKSDFAKYISFIEGKVADKSPELRRIWNSRQAYIAVGTLVAACAELKIDACPMEGFDPALVAEVLDLEEKGLDAVVIVAIGYRSVEDQTQHFPKVRKPKASLFREVA